MPSLRIGLGQYDIGWHDAAKSLDRAAAVVRSATASGAQLVALPEMSTTGFTMDQSQAEALGGKSASRLAALARECGVYLLAGIATRDGHGTTARHFNSAVLFDSAGNIAAEYRKRRLFGLAGENESYVPGDRTHVVNVHGVNVAPFICYDLRFPELFREVAVSADVMILIANWPDRRRAHWDALVHARAIENQCYFVAVNRSGEGGGAQYDGGSVAYGPWGELLCLVGDNPVTPAVVEVDSQRVADVRARYPFLADMQRT